MRRMINEPKFDRVRIVAAGPFLFIAFVLLPLNVRKQLLSWLESN